ATNDVPGNDEALGRLPHDDLADIRARAVFGQFIPMAADSRFHDGRFPRRLADPVIERPPTSQPGGEHVECVRLARIDANALAHGRDGHCRRHLSFSFCSLLLNSTSAWNAASASSQN